MGCDIHLYIEVKVDGVWELLNAEPNVDRYYPLFAKMGNVRNGKDIESLSDCRGLPENPSKMFMIAYEDNYEHSLSWLSSDEIAELSDWVDSELPKWLESHLNCYLFGNSFAGFSKYPKSYPEMIQDFRFIFWFDN